MNKKYLLLLLIPVIAIYFVVIRPKVQLQELADNTCSNLDGQMMLAVGPILKNAIDKAGKLGFSGPELGDKMRARCPDIMYQIEEWSNR